MKLQNMAIIFIMIILPVSIVLEIYTRSKIQTINIQTQYDAKLMNATYDAIKAYQINNFNNPEQSLTNSKIRDIQASVNTFYNSIATNFSSLGYSKSALQNFVPALVYTMYDGYYIYGPFTNVWDQNTYQEHAGNPTYTPNEIEFNLKPYVYYSCRYKKDDDNDVVITYSLDNYIQIQGVVGGNAVSKYGYVLGGEIAPDGSWYSPDGNLSNKIYIEDESDSNRLKEQLYVSNNLYLGKQYVKINGTKYYKSEDFFDMTNSDNQVRYGKMFYVNKKYEPQLQVQWNDSSQVLIDSSGKIINRQAREYYKQAYEMKQYINAKLKDWITTDNIVYDKIEQDDGSIINDTSDFTLSAGTKIFDNWDKINNYDSNFNTHRIDVIKHAVNKNLSVAISNYNTYYSTSFDFEMPKLKEQDWDKLISNIGMISFMQGMNIGGKIYNGYAIVNNNKNQDVVMEDSIYIKTNIDNEVHKITEKNLSGQVSNINDAIGIFNMDIERRSYTNYFGSTGYYFPIDAKLSYNSIVTQDNNIEENKKNNLNNSALATLYYTALGRERQSLYRQKLEF